MPILRWALFIFAVVGLAGADQKKEATPFAVYVYDVATGEKDERQEKWYANP
jgi:hypothetical protein